MRKTTYILLLLGISLFSLTACQKEASFEEDVISNGNNGEDNGGNSNGDAHELIGDYDFVGVSAHTLAIVTVSDGTDESRSETVSNYVSFNNSGTARITADKFSYTNVTYRYDTVMISKSYFNGVFEGESTYPLTGTYPATSASADYVRNNADSLTMSAQVLDNPSGPTPTGPNGFRISWSGDTLNLHVKTVADNIVTASGITNKTHGEIDGIMRLKKK